MKSKNKLVTILATLGLGIFSWILTFIGDSFAPVIFIWPAIILSTTGGISLFYYFKQRKP